MDPLYQLRRSVSSAELTATPPNDDKHDLQSRVAQLHAMREASDAVKLSLDLTTKTFSLPSLVLLLQKNLEQSQPQPATNPAFNILKTSDLRSVGQVQAKFTNTFSVLQEILVDQPGVSDPLAKEINELFGDSSALRQYGDLVASQTTIEALPQVTRLINGFRQMASSLESLPVSILDKGLSAVPHHASELQCFDGTLSRLEEGLEHIDNVKIAAGLQAPKSLLQQLNPAVPTPSSFILKVLMQAMQQSGVNQHVREGMEIHLRRGAQMLLGADARLITAKDTFAPAAVKNIPGALFYNSLVQFQSNLYKGLETYMTDSSTQTSVQEYQRQLQSALLQENSDADNAQILALLRKNPISKMLLAPVNQRNAGAGQDMTFEQAFGIWNDDSFKLDDWNWQALNQSLNDTVAQEWALGETLKPESEGLSGLRFDELRRMALTDPVEAGKSLYGQAGASEQYLALQFVAGLINESHGKDNQAAGDIRKQIVTILASPFLNPAEFKDLASADALQAIKQPLKTFIPLALDADTLKTQSPINTRLARSLIISALHGIAPVFPYCIYPLHQILANQGNQSQEPASLSHLLMKFDELHDAQTIANMLEPIDWQATKVEELMPLLRYAAETPAHLRAQALLQKIFEKSPALMLPILRHAVKTPTDQMTQAWIKKIFAQSPAVQLPAILMLMKEIAQSSDANLVLFFSRPPGANYLHILADDEVHRQIPQLAEKLLIHCIEQKQQEPIIRLLQSKLACESVLHQFLSTSYFNLQLIEELQPAFITNRNFQTFLDNQPWGISQYLDQAGTIEDSPLFKHVIEHANAARFAHHFDRFMQLVSSPVIAADQLVNKLLIPACFNGQTNNKTAPFFADAMKKIQEHAPDVFAQCQQRLLSLAASHHSNTDTLLTALIKILPEPLGTPMSPLLFTLAKDKDDRSTDLLQSLTKYIPIPTLQHWYQTAGNRAEFVAQVITALPSPEMFQNRTQHDAVQNLYQPVINEIVNAEQHAFLDALTAQTWSDTCKYVNKMPGQVFQHFYNQLSDTTRHNFKELLQQQRPEKIRSLHIECVEIIYSNLNSRSASDVQLAQKLQHAWN